MGSKSHHFLFCSHAKIHHSQITISSIRPSISTLSLSQCFFSLASLKLFQHSFQVYLSLPFPTITPHQWLWQHQCCHSFSPLFLSASSVQTKSVLWKRRRCSTCKCSRRNSNMVTKVVSFLNQVSLVGMRSS